MTTSTDYLSYTIPNSVLIEQIKLVPHTEGGASGDPPEYKWFSSRYLRVLRRDGPSRRGDSIALGRSEAAHYGDDSLLIDPKLMIDKALRPLATSIYYLLTPDEPNGVFHMNRSATMHVLHQGRAEYTLITPGNPPKVERKVMGPNIHAGEVLQLLVPTGVWKMSRLLPEDREAAASHKDGKECYGCLITEVVFPGFVWEDHAFLTPSKFYELFEDRDSPEVQELIKHVKKE